MKVTSEKLIRTSTIRTVEVQFDIEDLKECLMFTDEDGSKRGLPCNVVLSCVTPDPAGAPHHWEVVASFAEEVCENDGSWDPLDLRPLWPGGSAATKNEGAVLAVLASNKSSGRGMTDVQIVKAVSALGIGSSPAKKARCELLRRGVVVKVGVRHSNRKSGRPRAVYKLSSSQEGKP